jgi:hypothetical protein
MSTITQLYEKLEETDTNAETSSIERKKSFALQFGEAGPPADSMVEFNLHESQTMSNVYQQFINFAYMDWKDALQGKGRQ